MNNKDKYFLKWLSDSLSEEDMKAIGQEKELSSLRRLMSALSRFKAPEFDTETELKRLHQQQSVSIRPLNTEWIRPALRIAASLLLLAGLYAAFVLVNTTNITTPAAEKRQVVLPDGSMVELNAGTRLTYGKLFWKSRRRLSLDGEAFFAVESGSPFSVKTSSGTVRVLGTKFNINRRSGDYFEVACFEGLVEVQHDSGSDKVFPSQILRVQDGEKMLITGTGNSVPDWMVGESVFLSIPFGLVVRELEIQFGISIDMQAIDGQQRFSGRFSHSDLDNALKAITLPTNTVYEMTGDRKILLKGNAE